MTDTSFSTPHPEEKSVFIEAVEIESSKELREFLDAKCGTDDHLRYRIEALLEAFDEDSLLSPAAQLDELRETRSSRTGSHNHWEPPLPADLEPHMPGFAITELLGRGGMGAVYRGVQESLDREVAIKLLPPELSSNPQFASRFQREAKAMAQLNHPNIVQIYDFGITDQNHYYFVMEFVEGCDLRSYANSGKLTAADALVAVGQICGALQYAHEKGFIHRDIKPANIFLRNDGVLKVGDFGLAKLVDPESEKSAHHVEFDLTLTGMAMGTPNYISPEQLEGSKSIDHRADLYSLGVMFYEMLTGELPRGAVKPPSEKIQNLDVRIDDVVFKAMESKPEYRYQTATDLHTDLEAIRNTTSDGIKTSGKQNAKKKSTKSLWIIISINLIVISFFFFQVLPTLKKPPPTIAPQELSSIKEKDLSVRSKASTQYDNFRLMPALNQALSSQSPDKANVQLAISLVTNEIRRQSQIPELEISDLLANAAQMHAEDMRIHKFVSHTNQTDPLKFDPPARARMHGVSNPNISENISQGYSIRYTPGTSVQPLAKGQFGDARGKRIPYHTPLSLADALLRKLMASSEHKANILDPNAVAIGSGVSFFNDSNSRGMPSFYAVQKFQRGQKIKEKLPISRPKPGRIIK